MTGLSRQELLRRYLQARQQPSAATSDTSATEGPGRRDLHGIDDSKPAETVPRVILPFDLEPLAAPGGVKQDSAAVSGSAPDSNLVFGAEFFRLEAGLFQPPSFGPVPEDYLVGVGDQIVIDAWGEVEFRLERIVDRDGSIILPKGGKVPCANRTLANLERAIRKQLSRSYSGISESPGQGTIHLDVSLGRLRAIRVFVVGDAVQPGAYQLSSVATVFSALYAAGGPSAAGSMRDIRLVRGEETVATLDLYRYLLEGRRDGDAILREGDTVLIPPRGKTVRLQGQVRRPRIFELKETEGIAELLRFGGGFTASAATEVIHIERILPAALRAPRQPDRIVLDVELEAGTGLPLDQAKGRLQDGDRVEVGAIAERLENWVEILGNVKRPGRFEFREGLDVAELIALAGGLWRDTLRERALIDRTGPDGSLEALSFPLGDVLEQRRPPVKLQQQDRVRIFSKWDVQDRYEVTISGEVRAPGAFAYREGMNLRDLILRAGGLKESADVFRAEVSRLRLDAIESRDLSSPPAQIVDVIEVDFGSDYLSAAGGLELMPHDHVAIRKMPWWDLQRKVTVRGEVYYPGVYSLERTDETLSKVIERAGGLKPTAFAPGARILREKDEVGNIALDLNRAIKDPGSEYDIILQARDEIRIPGKPHTVKVVGAVGFPTSIIFEKGKGLGYYVNRAGGYGEKADKWKTRVVYPNGMSRPIKRIWRDPSVMPGSTIIVPVKSPDDGGKKLATLREIASILASAATIYLVIDRTTD